MELIAQINGAVNGFVWGAPMLVLLIGVGILMTVRNRGLQFRKFGYAMKNTIGKIFHKTHAGEGEITPFQAVSTALAGTVGTGNIAGITTAVTLGGPGTLFWLWVTALIGMATKYSEVLLAVKFRERNKYGDWVGGPMYYIKNGLGKHWKWLGVLFCVFAALAALGTGNAIQAGNIVGSIHTAVLTFQPDFAGEQTLNLVLGIVLAVLAAIVLFGGAVGSVFLVISWGMKRGIFSNEAGLGTAPMAHATTSEPEPVKQALYGIFEVFMDTIVICSLTGLTLLCSGINLNYGTMGETALVSEALGTLFTQRGGALVIAVALALFAFSTILGWALYGSRCCEFIFGHKAIKPYQILYVIVIVVGATVDLELVWDIADTLNGLMALPNLIALALLSGVVVKCTKAYFTKGTSLEEAE